MLNGFVGKTAVITGAGSGFGLACARLAAQRGMALVLVDVQAGALAQATAEISKAGVPVLSQVVDVSRLDEMQALALAVRQRFGAPHFVFNNAGVAAGGLLWEHSGADWNWVLGVNLMGVVHGVQVFVPMMLEAAKADPSWRGHVVNTASMAGLVCAPNMGLYNVSKHAVVALSESLYQDLRLVTDQIGASVLCPFFVPTGIHQSERSRPQTLTDPQARPTRSQLINQAMSEKAVLSGKVSAEQVAELVFAALENDQFYIYSHPAALQSVQTRLEDVMQARNPSDPFTSKPELTAQLKAALRG